MTASVKRGRSFQFGVRTLLAAMATVSLAASASAQESQFASDVRREKEAIKESCSSFAPKALGGCAYTLFTSYPLRVTAGSLAPLNGMGAGIAMSERYTPNESWRLTFSADFIRTFSGSQRFGGYAKFIHTPSLDVVVRRPGDPPVRQRLLRLDTWAFDLFAQRTSLETINYYGLGPDSLATDRSVFGERQNTFGGSLVLPMSGQSWLGALNPAIIGGVTGRVFELRPGVADDAVSIEQKYDNSSAPGLSLQDPFVELREGLRLRPALANGQLNFDYSVVVQQFITSTESNSSFGRLTFDLRHELPLYRGVSSSGPPRDFNGPNECSTDLDTMECPSVRRSRNRTGAINVRALVSLSHAPGDNSVPFYFQPTLGGSDLNGERVLASFADYRFRGPNLMAIQESIEHSLWGPIGVFALMEQGKVTRRRSDINLDDLVTSSSVGITLRAGGFPMLMMSYSWGSEGRHVIATMNTGLLGGGSRPSLF